MVKFQTSSAGYFTINNKDRGKGNFEIEVRGNDVGLYFLHQTYLYRDYLVYPTFYGDWTDGDDNPYTSLEDLIQDILDGIYRSAFDPIRDLNPVYLFNATDKSRLNFANEFQSRIVRSLNGSTQYGAIESSNIIVPDKLSVIIQSKALTEFPVDQAFVNQSELTASVVSNLNYSIKFNANSKVQIDFGNASTGVIQSTWIADNYFDPRSIFVLAFTGN